MTRQTFYRLLKKFTKEKGIKWYINEHGRFYDNMAHSTIRAEVNGNEYCPITFVAKIKLDQHYYAISVWDAGKVLGLNNEDISVIVGSADRDGDNKYGQTKARKTCRDALIRATNAKYSNFPHSVEEKIKEYEPGIIEGVNGEEITRADWTYKTHSVNTGNLRIIWTNTELNDSDVKALEKDGYKIMSKNIALPDSKEYAKYCGGFAHSMFVA